MSNQIKISVKAKCTARSLGISVAIGAAACSIAQAKPAPERPDFLLVYTDDQRWDALSVVQKEQGDRGRFPWIQTPNMDRLASQGIRFRNAFVVNSLCAPSRATILTGLYGFENGIIDNHTPFPDQETYATILRKGGYVTGFVGKWHMGNQKGQRPGFDYSASFIGQGKYIDCPFEINGQPTPTHGWVDDVSGDFAVDFIKQHHDRPFLLAVGFKSPHDPRTPPDRLKTLYEGAEAKPPVSSTSLAPYLPQPADGQPPRPGGPGPENIRDYFRVIHGADENLGRILDTLDNLGLTKKTVVIFTSDNGYYLGEHGLGDKRSAYEESMRVPMLLRYPALVPAGRLVDDMVLNLDIAPTIVELAGLRVPKRMQGLSWKPLLQGKNRQWRHAFFYDYFYERGFRTPTILAARTDTSKLVHYPINQDWTELFNLTNDPYEMRNQAADPTAKPLLQQMNSVLNQEQKRVRFRIPVHADQPPPLHGVKRPNTWVLIYDFSHDQDGTVVDSSGAHNNGEARAMPVVDSDGRKARRFDGDSQIDVPKTTSLDPSGGAWTVETVVHSEKPDGIILARGGRSQGYSLYLENGIPVFTVTAEGNSTSVRGAAAVTGRWSHLAGVIGADRSITLYVDGQPAGTAALPAFISQDPNEPMQIGQDAGSPVVDYQHRIGFVGFIRFVRIFSGQRSAAEVRQDSLTNW